MSILNEAANIVAPMRGRCIQLTITTTAALFEIPESFAGRYCSFCVLGTDVMADIAFGDSSVSVTYDTYSSVTSNEITISTSTGLRLIFNQPQTWIMPDLSEATHFSVDASATGALQIVASSK